MYRIKHIFFTTFISFLFTQTPDQFQLNDTARLNRFDHNSVKGQIANNAVIDIKNLGDSLYFFGTGNGLSYAEILNNSKIEFGYFSISNMPRGGNPALAVEGNTIAVAGVIDTAVATGTEPKGTGIAYSTDQGENWIYLPQPVDPDTAFFENYNFDQCFENDYEWNNLDSICYSNKSWIIPWGEQEIKSLLASSEVDNVSYDLSIGGDYIYAASWAGGLRRYPIGVLTNEEGRQWETIPLPRDDDLYLHCGEIDTLYYRAKGSRRKGAPLSYEVA